MSRMRARFYGSYEEMMTILEPVIYLELVLAKKGTRTLLLSIVIMQYVSIFDLADRWWYLWA